ncbi:MAG TPA: cupredoxin domain-containing protein [Kofleriaceae bacterium]|jgi:plastocyanin domain-containing protein
MTRAFVVVLVLVSACKKADNVKPAPPPAPAPAVATIGSDGLRHVAIEANKDGYTPDKIPGKPGEKLVLTFTRTFDASCISQVKTPDGKLVDLPLNKPVDVPVTVPQTGEVGFACGMDMFHGVVVAQP